jgi:hypothetical protein
MLTGGFWEWGGETRILFFGIKRVSDKYLCGFSFLFQFFFCASYVKAVCCIPSSYSFLLVCILVVTILGWDGLRWFWVVFI